MIVSKLAPQIHWFGPYLLDFRPPCRAFRCLEKASPLFGESLEVWENQHRKHRFHQGRVAIVRIWVDVSKFCLLEVSLEFEKRAISYPCPRVSSCCVNEWSVFLFHMGTGDVTMWGELWRFSQLWGDRGSVQLWRGRKRHRRWYIQSTCRLKTKAIVARSTRELWDDTSMCHHVMLAINTCLFGCRTSLWSSTTCVQHTRQWCSA